MEKENYNGYNNENGEPKLYDDLPKEIVDMLRETHPLMGKKEPSEDTMYQRRNRQQNQQSQIEQNEFQQNTSVDWSGTSAAGEDTIIGRRTRRYAQEDSDQQYTMRFQTIQSESDIPQNTYQNPSGYDNQEGIYQTQRIDFTPQYSPHQQNYDSDDYNTQYNQQPEYQDTAPNFDYQNSYQNGYQQDDYQQDGYSDGYSNEQQPFYDTPPEKRKGPLMQEIQITLPGPGGQSNSGGREDENRRNRHNNYEDFDVARGAKQMDLDELYSDDYDDEEPISFHPGKKFGIIFSIIAIVLIGFLGFRCISLGSKLKQAEQKVAENEELNEKYQTLQMDNLKLEEELKTLKSGEAAPTESQGEETTQPNDAQNNSEETGNFDWYTVTESDKTWWTLAQRFYGDGTQYTKILEANGKKEGDYLRAGDKIKIPK